MVLADETKCNSCTCPMATSARYAANAHGGATDFRSKLNAGWYEPIDDWCNWDCSAGKIEQCRERNEDMFSFPDCGCAQRERKKKKLRAEGTCRWHGVRSEFGCNSCSCKTGCDSGCTTENRLRCSFTNGKCKAAYYYK
jgi:hypothetical protein